MVGQQFNQEARAMKYVWGSLVVAGVLAGVGALYIAGESRGWFNVLKRAA